MFLASSRLTGFGVLVYLPSSRLVYFFCTLGSHGSFAKVLLEVLTHSKTVFDTVQHAPVLGRNFVIHSCFFVSLCRFQNCWWNYYYFHWVLFVLFRISIRLVSSPCQCALFVKNAFVFLIGFGPFSESLVVDNALSFWLASGPCQSVYLLRTRLDF